MPKYLAKVVYSAQGAQLLLKEGGTVRRAVVQKMVEAAGGKLEAFYFAYGEVDAYAIVDVPDPSAGLAMGLTISATGIARISTIPLITMEEIDAAREQSVAYKTPEV